MMVWEHFDGAGMALHLVAVLIVAAFVLTADYGFNQKERGRSLAIIIVVTAVIGSLVYAGLFDSQLLQPFDWKSVGFIECGGGVTALAVKYVKG